MSGWSLKTMNPLLYTHSMRHRRCRIRVSDIDERKSPVWWFRLSHPAWGRSLWISDGYLRARSPSWSLAMLSALETYFRATSRRARHSAHVYCGRRQRLLSVLGLDGRYPSTVHWRKGKNATPGANPHKPSFRKSARRSVQASAIISNACYPRTKRTLPVILQHIPEGKSWLRTILEIYLNATALLGSYCMRFSARSIAKHINAAYTELETLTVPPTRNFLSPSPEVPIWRVDVRRELEWLKKDCLNNGPESIKEPKLMNRKHWTETTK